MTERISRSMAVTCIGTLSLTAFLSALPCATLIDIAILLGVAVVAFGITTIMSLDKRSHTKTNESVHSVTSGLFALTVLMSIVTIYHNSNNEEKLIGTNSKIENYQNYYNATEELLDSIGIDADSPILESDAGAHYLNVKAIIDGEQYNQRCTVKIYIFYHTPFTNRILNQFKHYQNEKESN